MNIFDSYELVDKINSKILWTAGILGLLTAISTIWNSIKETKTSKFISIALATLTAFATLTGVYFGDYLSDIQKKKEDQYLKRLANFSTAITQSKSANNILENKVKYASEKLRLNVRPLKSIYASLSDTIEYLPASGTVSYVKGDSSAHKAIIKSRVPGQTINGLPEYELDIQGETVTLELLGNMWIIKR